MSLFDTLGGQAPMNPMQMMMQLRSNPAAVLKQRGLNVPDGMSDPQQIVQHLISSGQVSNNALQSAMQMMGRR
jgi:hypothetical protein